MYVKCVCVCVRVRALKTDLDNIFSFRIIVSVHYNFRNFPVYLVVLNRKWKTVCEKDDRFFLQSFDGQVVTFAHFDQN